MAVLTGCFFFYYFCFKFLGLGVVKQLILINIRTSFSQLELMSQTSLLEQFMLVTLRFLNENLAAVDETLSEVVNLRLLTQHF